MEKQGGYDPLAKYYDRLARLVFGQAMVRSQTFFLDWIPAGSRILILGGGTGWWLRQLLQSCPDGRILYIDASVKMLTLAREVVNNDPRITFIHGTHEVIAEVNAFDTIITFYFLDLFSQQDLGKLVKMISVSAKPNALWLVTDFVKTRKWHALLLRVMYIFFRLTTGLHNQKLPDWEKALMPEGISLLAQKMFYGEFIKAGAYKVTKQAL